MHEVSVFKSSLMLFILLSPASGERLGEGEVKNTRIIQGCGRGCPLT